MTTPTITVSADQWADLTMKRSGWVAVEGMQTSVGTLGDPTATITSPPAELWAASQPCDVCEGGGWDWKLWTDEDLQVDDPVDEYRCQHCKGHGKPLVAVETECQCADINGRLCTRGWHSGSIPPEWARWKSQCSVCTDGKVIVGYVTVREVVLIVSYEHLLEPLLPCIELWDDGAAFHWSVAAIESGAALTIDLPDAKPGMYAVHVEMVTP